MTGWTAMEGRQNEDRSKRTVSPLVYPRRDRRDPDGSRGLAAGLHSAAGDGHRHVRPGLLPLRRLWTVAARADRRAGRRRVLSLFLSGESPERGHRREVPESKASPVSLRDLHRRGGAGDPPLVGYPAWFTAYLGPRIGAEAAIAAVTAYQDDMLIAILPMYLPMVFFIGIHFGMLLAGKTRYPRWMLVFHPVTWNILLAGIPDIAQAMRVPAATWMSVMSQSSTNTAIVIWCIAAAIYGKSTFSRRKGPLA